MQAFFLMPILALVKQLRSIRPLEVPMKKKLPLQNGSLVLGMQFF